MTGIVLNKFKICEKCGAKYLGDICKNCDTINKKGNK